MKPLVDHRSSNTRYGECRLQPAKAAYAHHRFSCLDSQCEICQIDRRGLIHRRWGASYVLWCPLTPVIAAVEAPDHLDGFHQNARPKMTSVRSTNGCHTCRIRKKKCDEGRPVCTSCVHRGIPCYGYDPMVTEKHSWAQIEATVKKAAEQRYRARRQHGGDVASNIKLEKGVVEVDKYKDRAIPSHHLVTWDSTSSQANDPLRPDTSFPSSPYSLESWTSLTNKAATAAVSTAKNDSLATPRKPESIFWDGCFSSYTLPGPQKDVLFLIHYLQNVFPLQFGFYPKFSSESSERRHFAFLDLVLRSKPLYYACLSVSICHHDVLRAGLNAAHSSAIVSMDLARVHSLTLLETKHMVGLLEKLKGKDLLAVGVETLACIQQLISVEVFRDIEGSWELHFSAARNIFHMLCKQIIFKQYRSVTRSPPTSVHDTTTMLTFPVFSQHVHSLQQSENPTVSFFLASFLWLDVIAQACGVISPVHWNPTAVTYLLQPQLVSSNTTQHQPVFIDLQRHMGCANWAMLSIINISSLQAWKKNAISNNQPNTSELSRRAALLLCKLEEGIDNLLRERETLESSTESSDSDSSLVTELYARAATTYLHIVVTGAKPRDPEIRQSVSKTVELLKALPIRLIIRVSWPYTITGCMAVGEEQSTCMDIMETCVEEGLNTGTAWKGVALMEECWKVTNSDLDGNMHSDGFGLAEAMKVLNKKILLC